MVVVTGTKRSGTSLWMRMLVEAGFPHFGDRFPARWKHSMPTANPGGFYESRLRRGVYFATNPDPETGEYLTAKDCRGHAVKVFVPGVVRTERAYLTRVVATMRHWRAYARSLAAMEAEEDAWLLAHPREGLSGEETVARARRQRGHTPAPIEWFLLNYELVRDFSVRRYPIHFTTYERLMEAPEPTIDRVFDWLGPVHADLDRSRARACIDPALQRSSSRTPVASEASVGTDDIRLFDAFHEAVHETSSLPKTLLAPLNDAWKRLSEAYGRPKPSDDGGD